ncbi:MAG: hypothetical protein HYT80_03495 [Euryarchaeota archaeon]|nr:hypothetical protein [Euryarchaeota archaeon]
MNAPARTLIVTVTLAFFIGTPLVSAYLPGSATVGPTTFADETTPAWSEDVKLSTVSSEPEAGSDAGYRLYFKCTAVEADPGPPPKAPAAVRCPYDVVDEVDIMGQPVLLIDPKEVGYLGFNALHGGHGVFMPGKEPPTNQSRDNLLHQTHTTFYNFEGNHRPDSWIDNPYYSPLKPPPDRSNLEDPLTLLGFAPLNEDQVFGTDNAAVLDAEGRVYLASLYAFRNGTMKDYAYAIGFWKSGRVNRPVDYFSGNTLKKFPEGVVIDSIHAIYVPHSNRVVVLWREVNETKSYINFAHTEPGKGGRWEFAKMSARMGDCMGISNPVQYLGKVYIGCFADKNYAYANGSAGAMHIHSIETMGNRWTAAYHDETTIQATSGQRPNAVLVDALDGRLVAVSAGVSNNGRPFIRMAKAADYDFARAWDDPTDYSGHINRGAVDRGEVTRAPGGEVVEARINGATIVYRSGNIHMIYMERWKPPQNEGGSGYVPEFYKAVVSVNYGGGEWNKLLPLGVDAAPDTPRQDDKASKCQIFESRYQGVGKDVFNDLHDSIVTWFKPKTNREQREFIAFQDCGNVRFAEVFEENALLFGFPVPPGTPPIPTPVAGANPAQVGAIAGALAGAMVLRMLAFKRKLAVEAPA